MHLRRTPTTFASAEMALSKSYYNLEEICLQLNSHWQYIDLKMVGGKGLTSVQQTLSDEITCTGHQIPQQYKTSTVYTIVKDRFSGGGEGSTDSVKTFFTGFTQKSLSFKEKENVYWKIRMRYACGIIPIAVIYITKELRKLGYTSWLLPNGEIVS